eukprot:403350676
MVIDCYFYKNCKDQYGVSDQKIKGQLRGFLQEKQRYALYEVNDNPTYSQVIDVLEHGIRTNFSPSLKTFVLNLNGNAKIYPNYTNDILFLLKYDKAYQETSASFNIYETAKSDKNALKYSKLSLPESNEVNLNIQKHPEQICTQCSLQNIAFGLQAKVNP